MIPMLHLDWEST